MAGVKGKSGRKPLPKAAKELAGTFRGDRHNPNSLTIAPLTTLPRCPAHIQGVAQKTWRRVGKLLVEMGVLTAVDLDGLEAYCVIVARWQYAEAHLAETNGLMTLGGLTGLVVVTSPYLRIADDCLKQIRGWMSELGITPASRVKVDNVKPTDPEKEAMDDYFFGRRN